MPWSLYDPEAAIAEEVHGLLEGTEPLPGTVKFGTIFRLLLGVKELPMPLTIFILEVAWTTVLKGTRPEQASGVWEDL